MKRDMDLIRAMLLKVEADPHGFAPVRIEIPNHSQEEVQYHAFLLGEAGLAQVTDVTANGSDSPAALIVRLTWQGHEFLDAAREDDSWKTAKDTIGKIGGATLQIWIAVLTRLIEKKLGL